MNIIWVINRYIFRELLTPFGINVSIFTSVFLMAELIQITNWIVNYNLNIFTVLQLIIYQTPYFLIFVIPLSIMITVLLTFLRLSGQNEITALKSGGISIYRLLGPVFAFCFIGFVLTMFMSVYGQPWGRSALRELTYKVISTNVDMGLKERTFYDSFTDVILYVNKIELKNKMLIDVFIEDKREPERVITVIAPRGQIYSKPQEPMFYLRLFNGTIHQTNLKEKASHAIHFDTYDISFDMKQATAVKKNKPTRPKEMTIGKLHQSIRNFTVKDDRYFKLNVELHRRLSLPFGCFVLGLLAVSLGVQSKSAKRPFGLILGLFFFLFYYLLLSLGKVYGETGVYPPVIGMWLPNFVMGALGVYFLIQTANERMLKIHIFLLRLQRVLPKFSR